MSTSRGTTLAPMVDKLRMWGEMSKEYEAAILALPHTLRRLRGGSFIAREGDSPQQTCLLLSGYAIRHKLAGDGGRQIFSIHMNGDIVDLQNSMLQWSDQNVEALTTVETAFIPMDALHRLIADHPNVAHLLWYETLVDGSIFREWKLNIGRRDARARMAHILCELAMRLKRAGPGELLSFDLPMTQDDLSDVLALSRVHVSRVIKSLTAEGYITKTKRAIRIDDWERLRQIGDFDPRYLQYNGARAAAAAAG